MKLKIQKLIKSALFNLSCQHYTELASHRLDTRLSPLNCIIYWMHHVVCTFCRRSSRQMTLIENGMSKLVDQEHIASQEDTTRLTEERKSKIKEVLSKHY